MFADACQSSPLSHCGGKGNGLDPSSRAVPMCADPTSQLSLTGVQGTGVRIRLGRAHGSAGTGVLCWPSWGWPHCRGHVALCT